MESIANRTHYDVKPSKETDLCQPIEIDNETNKYLLRKIDWRVLPVVSRCLPHTATGKALVLTCPSYVLHAPYNSMTKQSSVRQPYSVSETTSS